MSKILRAAIGATLLAAAGIAGATTVGADLNTFNNGNGADSGLFLNFGEAFTVTASGTWGNDPNPYYWAGPNGNTVQGALTQSGLSAQFGTLVGEIGGGPVFAIGSDFSGVANGTGELKFFFWDSDVGTPTNNVGFVEATATAAVPEPATFALMGLGLGLVGLGRRRKI